MDISVSPPPQHLFPHRSVQDAPLQSPAGPRSPTTTAPPPAPTPTLPSFLVGETGEDAAKFLEQTDLMELIAEGLNTILVERPRFPIHALVQHLRTHNKRAPPATNQVKVAFNPAQPRVRTLLTLDHCVCPISDETRCPELFHKAGEYPVYVTPFPTTASELDPVVNRIKTEDRATKVVWLVLAPCDTALFYVNDNASTVPLTAKQWGELRTVLKAQMEPETTPSAEGGSDTPAAPIEAESISWVDCVDHLAKRIEGGATVQDVLKQRCLDAHLSYDWAAFQHPLEHEPSIAVMDGVSKVLDRHSDPNTAFVVIAPKKSWEVVQHVAALAGVYCRMHREVQHLVRMLRIQQEQKAETDEVDAQTHTQEANKRRAKRRKQREEALAKRLEALAADDREEDPLAIIERENAEKRRTERHDLEDHARTSIGLEQNKGAAVKVQSFMRGVMTRRRVQAGTLGTRKATTNMSQAQVYKGDSRYPLVDMVQTNLVDHYGPDFFTATAKKRVQPKQYHKWIVSSKRVPPQYDGDVSSEEETWTQEPVQRVSDDVSTAFNPLSDVVYVMDLLHCDDRTFLFDVYNSYNGVSSLQWKAARVLERLCLTVMYSAFMSLHHKRKNVENVVNTMMRGKHETLLHLPSNFQAQPFSTWIYAHHDVVRVWQTHLEWIMTQTFRIRGTPVLHDRLLMQEVTPQEAAPVVPVTEAGDSMRTAAVAAAAAADAAGAPTGQNCRQLCPRVPVYIARENLTTDEWCVAAADIVRKGRLKRLAWLSTRPDPMVFVSGVPYCAARRHHHHLHGDELMSAHSIRNTRIRTEAFKGAHPLFIPPMKRFEAHELHIDLSMPGSPLGSTTALLQSQNQQPPAALTGQQSVNLTASASVSDLLTPTNQQARRNAFPVDLKQVEVPWFSVKMDQVEQRLCEEIVQSLEEEADGVLKAYRSSALVEKAADPAAINLDTGNMDGARLTPLELRVARSKKREQEKESSKRDAKGKKLSTVPTSKRHTLAMSDERTLPPRASDDVPRLKPLLQAPRESIMVVPKMSSKLVDSQSRSSIFSPITPDAATPKLEVKTSLSGAADGEDGPLSPSALAANNAPAEVTKTPAQCGDDVRARLRKIHGLDNALSYRRLPIMESWGQDWLRAVDQLYSLSRSLFADHQLAMTLTVASPQSLLYPVMVTMIWGVDFNKGDGFALGSSIGAELVAEADESARSTPNTSTLQVPSQTSFDAQEEGGAGLSTSHRTVPTPTPTDDRNSARSTRTIDGNGSQIMNTKQQNSMLGRTVSYRCGPVTCFRALLRLMDENPLLELRESVRYVDSVLDQTKTRAALFDVIGDQMRVAETAEDAGVRCNAVVAATCALERYICLVLFHGFLKTAKDRRTMMSSMHIELSYASYINAIPDFQRFLDTLNPWEGMDDSVLLQGEVYNNACNRWKRKTWIDSIG